jgi:hypothetical protein
MLLFNPVCQQQLQRLKIRNNFFTEKIRRPCDQIKLRRSKEAFPNESL